MKKDETYLTSTVNYIKRNLRKGYNKDSLKWMLTKQGISRQEVEKAFVTAEKEIINEQMAESRRVQAMIPPPKIEPIIEEKPKKGFLARLFGL